MKWVRRYPDYARLQIMTDHASLLVDLVLETLELPATLTIVGPTGAEQDVADSYQESFDEIRRFYVAWRAALLR